jgi:ribosomal protein L31
MRDAKKQLVRNERAKKMGAQIQISTRQPRNLKRIVTQNNPKVGGQQPPSPQNRGCFKCKKCKVSCPVLKEGNKFMSSNTKKIYNIQQNLTCDSTYTVYLATCKKCHGQYVGKSTQTFKKRHSGHKQEVKNRIGGLGGHYGGSSGCGYDHLSVQIIDQVELGDDEALAKCETYWQHQLRCYVENGGRAHCYRKEITRTRI